MKPIIIMLAVVLVVLSSVPFVSGDTLSDLETNLRTLILWFDDFFIDHARNNDVRFGKDVYITSLPDCDAASEYLTTDADAKAICSVDDVGAGGSNVNSWLFDGVQFTPNTTNKNVTANGISWLEDFSIPCFDIVGEDACNDADTTCSVSGSCESIAYEFGANFTGDINMGFNNIQNATNVSVNGTIDMFNLSITRIPTNDAISGDAFAIFMSGVTGEPLPHLVIQPGGFGQGSYISRSLMIVDEVVSIMNNTNRTSCQAWADYFGKTLKIDCNTTTTGADLFVGDDMQVFGDIWILDTDDEWHFLTREMQLRDEFYKNIFFNNLTASTIIADVYSFNDTLSETFVVNINGTETLLDVINESVTLTTGTSSSPVLNFVNYYNASGPTLTVGMTEPNNVAEVARIYMGGSGNVYASLSGITNNDEFFKKIFKFAVDIGPLYLSGFTPNVNASGLSFGSGIMSLLLTRKTISSQLDVNNGFFFVLNNNSFMEITSLDDINEYSTGDVIGNNKYYNIVWGITHVDVGPSRLIAVIQDKPSSEYVNLEDAEVDQFGATNTLPVDPKDFLRKTYIPIARTVVKKVVGADEFQQLSNGLFYFDERGTTTRGGSAASPSITDHDDLNNLGWNVSGHTGNATQFDNSGSSISILESWITGFFNTLTKIIPVLESNGIFHFNDTTLADSKINFTPAAGDIVIEGGLTADNATLTNLGVGTDPPVNPGITVDGVFTISGSSYAAISSVPIVTASANNTIVTGYSSSVQGSGTEFNFTYIAGMLGSAFASGNIVTTNIGQLVGARVQSVGVLGANIDESIGLYIPSVVGGKQNWGILDVSGRDSNISGNITVQGMIANSQVCNATNCYLLQNFLDDTDTDTYNTSAEMFLAVNGTDIAHPTVNVTNITVYDSVILVNSTASIISFNGSCTRINNIQSGRYMAIC